MPTQPISSPYSNSTQLSIQHNIVWGRDYILHEAEMDDNDDYSTLKKSFNECFTHSSLKPN